MSEILEAVAREGDEAVIRYTEKFGGVRLDAPRFFVTPAELGAARSGLPKDVQGGAGPMFAHSPDAVCARAGS